VFGLAPSGKILTVAGCRYGHSIRAATSRKSIPCSTWKAPEPSWAWQAPSLLRCRQPERVDGIFISVAVDRAASPSEWFPAAPAYGCPMTGGC
jgi:hypothetical protein